MIKGIKFKSDGTNEIIYIDSPTQHEIEEFERLNQDVFSEEPSLEERVENIENQIDSINTALTQVLTALNK